MFILNSPWNANSYEVISINNVTNICIKRERMEKEVREYKMKKEQIEKL